MRGFRLCRLRPGLLQPDGSQEGVRLPPARGSNIDSLRLDRDDHGGIARKIVAYTVGS